jgi:membrane protease YdiL (CAAX protease family)
VLPPPYWGYDDIGIFFLILVLLRPMFRLCVRFHFLRASDFKHPSAGLQGWVVVFLSFALYLVLKLRHHAPVLRPLGWVLPTRRHAMAAIVVGVSLATAVTIYLRLHNQRPVASPAVDLLLLGIALGPILEESLFRGCLLPLVAASAGDVVAVVLSAVLFALFHGPTDLQHWVSFTTTGIAYGWLRVVSRSTTAPAVTHATYNLVLFLLAST